jgi:hypothetical protein
LADAGIELRIDDLRYERYFKKRKKMIEEWYSEKNFKKNLLTIIKQIEKRTNKNFSNSTINKIFKKYKVNK